MPRLANDPTATLSAEGQHVIDSLESAVLAINRAASDSGNSDLVKTANDFSAAALDALAKYGFEPRTDWPKAAQLEAPPVQGTGNLGADLSTLSADTGTTQGDPEAYYAAKNADTGAGLGSGTTGPLSPAPVGVPAGTTTTVNTLVPDAQGKVSEPVELPKDSPTPA